MADSDNGNDKNTYVNHRIWIASLEAALARCVAWAWRRRIWSKPFARTLAVPFFYLIATIIMTWPYVLDFATEIPGWPMDNFNFLYKIWWVSHALFGTTPPGSSPTFNPAVFYPVGYNLAQGELSPANTLLTVPITATLGPVISYNTLVFASFVLSGWGMYLLVKYLLTRVGAINPHHYEADTPATISPPSFLTPHSSLLTNLAPHSSLLIALLCGLDFAFCPYRMEQMGGHLQMLGTQWLPFTFLYLEKMLRGRRWQDGALAGLFFAFCCWEAWYYAAIIGLFVAIYIPLRWWQLRRQAITVPAATKRNLQFIIHHSSFIIAFIIITALMVLPFAIPYLQLRDAGSLAYSATLADENSAVPPDYFLPSMLHPLWGAPFMRLHKLGNPLENDLYLGVVPLALFAYAVATRRRQLRQADGAAQTRSFPFAAYLLIAGLGFVFSLGLSLHTGIFLRSLGVAGAKSSDGIWMPGWLLYEFAPLFSAIRAYARFGLMVIFAVIVLAALGLALLLRRPRFAHYPYLTITVLTLLLLLDFAATPYAYGMSRVQSQPQNDWLAAQPGNAAVAYFPADYALQDGPATWYSVYYQKPIAYGYESFLPTVYYQPDVRVPLLNFPDDARVWPLLKSWGVRYVMVSATRFAAGWPPVEGKLAANPLLRYVTHFQEQPLWEGNPRLWRYWPAFAWHAQPNDIYVYELV